MFSVALAARVIRNAQVRASAVAIGLALVPLIVITIVADGMIEGITSRYIELGTYHLRAYLAADVDADTAVGAVRGLDGVTAAFLETDGEALARASGRSAAVRLRCVDPALGEEPGFRRYLEITEGEFSLEAPGAALLGQQTAESLGLRVGDELQLATLATYGRSAVPRVGRARVVGVFSTGYQDLDRSWVFVSSRDGERLVQAGRGDSFIGIKIVDPFGDRESIMAAVRAAVPEARVYDWYEVEIGQFRSFEVTRNLLVFIMGLIVLVGSVNVSSAVLMVVLERQRDIGILKSMGASPAAIRRAFLLVGLLVGAAGSLGGTAVGLLVGIHVNELFRLVEWVVNLFSGSSFRILGSAYYIERVPVHLRLPVLYAAAAGTIGLAVVAAWIPARRAGRLRPLEVIRRH